MDVGSAALLGAVQGATEFLPVSSSGHISLTAMLLGVSDEMPLAMVVLLHFGTLVATIGVLRGEVWVLFKGLLDGLKAPRAWLETDVGKEAAGVVLASVPTAIIGLAIESRIEAYSRLSWVIGLGLLVSAVAVLSTRRGGGERSVLPLPKALLVGVVQGIAVLPGISRSGSTIAVAMLLGLSGPAAFRFSFLLSLPAVAGATLLSLRHHEEMTALGTGGIVGGVVAFAVGLGALVWLRHLVNRGRFWTFAIYLAPLGAGLVIHHLVSLS
ncbi:MAG: undecaprenyl-diphosphate phosphatase [Sandaracinaceae bacterium]